MRHRSAQSQWALLIEASHPGWRCEYRPETGTYHALLDLPVRSPATVTDTDPRRVHAQISQLTHLSHRLRTLLNHTDPQRTRSRYMRLTSQNLLHGATQTPEGVPQDRWPAVAEAIRAENPDILCLQELHGWTSHNYQQLFRAERDLGMRVAGWVPPARSRGGTLLMYRHRPGGIRMRQWESANSTELYNGLGVAVFDFGGDAPLTVAGVHLQVASIEAATQEALLAVSRAYRYGGLGVVMGDFNHQTLDDPAPDHTTRSPLSVAARWRFGPDGSIVPDRSLARKLVLARMTDAAAHLAQVTGDASLTAPTAGGGIRTDQAWVTPPLVPALAAYRRIPHDASDHHLISVDLDPNQITVRADGRAG
ncbi:endonuclease/exonuclease/phosphatase family protein [Actinorugispora endophytica]|uniref:Endonuclease/exonuclease/phosphatase family metal-dependent hydrolase n=1 Tax=Actinorugispora endophytica TaxID=1605990 RepID=A0A4R6V633_9ACTN|nr:endonuclease/exonuclease/phosphatase family protein [Actinorugispora endophytica]TDQ54315.1 endonuclease/exonuclease/phosphatase family metal-dependent hydrolase [Actinorugispora endophytica]